MSLIYNPDEPIEVQLGDLTLDDVIFDGTGIIRLRDIPEWWPYYDVRFDSLHLYDIVITYEYFDDGGIPYHRLDLDPYITNYLYEMKDFRVFVDLAEEMFSDFYSLAWAFDSLASVDDVPEIFLPKLSYLTKYKYRYDISDDINRDMIKRLFWLYEQKATDKDVLDHADFANNPGWFGSTLFYPWGYPDDRVADLEYPVDHLFTHDVSTHSGIDRFQDSTRYRDGVIVIKLIQVTEKVREAIRRVLPAGIKFYFDVDSEFSGTEDPSVTGRGGIINMWSWIKILMDYVIDYFLEIDDNELKNIGFDVSARDVNHYFSGHQILYFDRVTEFTNVATSLPIYVRGYFGSLDLNYKPEEPIYDIMPLNRFGNRWSILKLANEVANAVIEGVYNKDLEYSSTGYSGKYNAKINVTELHQAYLEAKRFSETYSVSSQGGIDIPPAEKWIPQTVQDEFLALIEKARRLENEPTSQFDVDNMTQKLRDFMERVQSQLIRGNLGNTADKWSIDFTYQKSQYGGEYRGIPDVTALLEAIEYATQVAYSQIVSDDGTDVSPYKMWMPRTEFQKFLDLIQEARILAFMPTTQVDVDRMTEKLYDYCEYYLTLLRPGSAVPTADKYDVNFIYDLQSMYGGKFTGSQIIPPPEFDTGDLEGLIEEAERLLEEVQPSNNGLDIPTENEWVPFDVWQELEDAVKHAESVLNTFGTQEDIDDAARNLQRAMDKFNENRKPGLHEDVVHPQRVLGDYHEIDQLRLGIIQKFLSAYHLNDVISDFEPKYADFSKTDIWKHDDPSTISIPNYQESYGKLTDINRYSPYTEEPIHDIDYEIYDTKLVKKWKGLPTYSEQFVYGGKRRYGGEDNIVYDHVPVEDVLPQDDWYPVSAIEDLYPNLNQGDSRVAENYNGIITARNSYYKPRSQFKDNELVDVDGKAVLLSELSEDEIQSITVGEDLLKFTWSNEFYIQQYAEPIEVELVMDNA